ncbi:hypothetical protein IMZ48_35910 [Candidatus Bathyarchaeota archaeon]|nr:hypothetical protein [Candidatus Bathyarchaeota archaeon]
MYYGLGKHSEQLDPPTMKMNSRLAYAGGFCCILSLGLSKTSFCLTLMRISSGWTKGAVWFVLLSVDAVLIAHGAIQWLQCWPTAKMWDWDIPGKCMNPAVVTTYNTFSTRKW